MDVKLGCFTEVFLTHFFPQSFSIIFAAMKNMLLFLLLISGVIACKTAEKKEAAAAVTEEQEAPLPPGSVLLADSIRIPDPLNELYYSVKLVANEHTHQGTYDVKVLYGHNNAETQITFPRGGTKKIVPRMQKGSEPFSFIIGFNYGEDDPTFYEYYLVKGAFGKIEMKYLKAYSFK